ncbi:ankyrin repeat-containing domain protein [Russula earlei]|uniref:Ankyrin repeat-containing domain protein n=1 Tax=Russula earlei TaxID=71964 RepID=A0ACC0U2N9_9AGAM|nr:ankyrin repeat-containing domain protein [Russula earlei]
MPDITPSTQTTQASLTTTPSINAQFLDAVTRGDESQARSLLARGADVNATDAMGRSAVACVIAGESWQTVDPSFMTTNRLKTLRLLVEDRHVSLYTLNAPQEAMNGVTPLGFAAWMNSPQTVQVLLEARAGAVSVDGKDAYGVTPLMYATRDGNSEVVDCLLLHGARPDHRDRNYRTSIQYSLCHPQILWACEEALRHYRAREIRSANGGIKPNTPEAALKPAAGSSHLHSSHLFAPAELLGRTDALVRAIVSSDVVTLYSLLSALSTGTSSEGVPSLVNAPDAEAWSPVHYCASLKQPSVEVLDILYCAGADVSLFSKTGNCTPLHCLARRKRGPDALRDQASNGALYRFVVHLVRDLRAPLQAQDHNNETCVHIAAEHGDSAEVLRAMLDSDPAHVVLDVRNSRGLTPLEVARAEFRPLFAHFHDERRPASSASHATVRPLHNSGSDMSLSTLTPRAYSAALSPLPDDDVNPSAFEKVLDTLNTITISLSHPPGFTSSGAALDRFDALLRDAAFVSQGAISQLYSRLDEAREETSRARVLWSSADASLDTISQAVEENLKTRPFIPRGPGIEDSSHESVATSRSSSDIEENPSTSPGFASELLALNSSELDRTLLKPWPRTRDSSADSTNLSTTQEGDPTNSIARLRSHKSMSDLRQSSLPLTQDDSGGAEQPVRRARADTLTDIGMRGGRSRHPPETGTEGEGKRARLKAWLRRTFLPERLPRTLPQSQKIEEPPSSLTTLVEKDENVTIPGAPVHPSYRVLAAVGKDLARIDECMSSAEKLIASAHRAIVRAERGMRRALQARRKLIHDHRRSQTRAPKAEGEQTEQEGTSQPSPPLRVIIPQTESPATSPAQSPTARSATSSISSLASTKVESGVDRETDTEMLRRIYVKKVEGRFEGAYAGLEKAEEWLKIVQTVLEDVERRGGGIDERM